MNINQSTGAADCGLFVEFMLEKILATLRKRQGEPLSKENIDTTNDTVNDTVNLIKANPKITLDELALKLGKSRRTVTRIIKRLQEENIISRKGSNKTGYWEVKNGYKFPMPVRSSSLIER